MALLLRAALDVVRDADAPHGLRAVAAKTLLSAFEHEIETPTGAPLAVWRWLSTSGGDCVRFSQLNRLAQALADEDNDVDDPEDTGVFFLPYVFGGAAAAAL